MSNIDYKAEVLKVYSNAKLLTDYDRVFLYSVFISGIFNEYAMTEDDAWYLTYLQLKKRGK